MEIEVTHYAGQDGEEQVERIPVRVYSGYCPTCGNEYLYEKLFSDYSMGTCVYCPECNSHNRVLTIEPCPRKIKPIQATII